MAVRLVLSIAGIFAERRIYRALTTKWFVLKGGFLCVTDQPTANSQRLTAKKSCARKIFYIIYSINNAKGLKYGE
jgi:hypothetical protein